MWGLGPARIGRARLGMTLEPLRWLHCSISGRCLLRGRAEWFRGAAPERGGNKLKGLQDLYLEPRPDALVSLGSGLKVMRVPKQIHGHLLVSCPRPIPLSRGRDSQIGLSNFVALTNICSVHRLVSNRHLVFSSLAEVDRVPAAFLVGFSLANCQPTKTCWAPH